MQKISVIFLCLLLLVGCVSTNKQADSHQSGVVYEIFVQSFSDSNQDGIGDLNGITNRLDYLADLGIQQLWLTPINASSSYHRYDVDDYLKIDEELGTMDDLQNLINEAQKREIGIILDLVVNHSSNQCNWFLQSKQARLNNDTTNYYYNFYHYSDKPLNNYHYLSNNLYYEGYYHAGMPDLNLDEPNVREQIAQIITYYLNMGIAGFRLDSGAHFYEGSIEKNNEFASWLAETARSVNPDVYLVSEVWMDYTTVKEYYHSGLDSFFDFDLSSSGAIYKSINSENGAALAETFATRQQQIKQINPAACNAIFLSNHDQSRSAGTFIKEESIKLAAAVYLLSPFKPFIYYGEEIGMKGSGVDQNKRMAMLWGESQDCQNPIGTDYKNQINSSVSVQAKDENSIYQYYKQILNMRNLNPFLIHCDCENLSLDNDKLFALRCYDDTNDIIIIHNFSGETISFNQIDGYQLQSSLNKKNKANKIEPYSSLILEKK